MFNELHDAGVRSSVAPVAVIALPAPEARSPTCPVAAAPTEVVLTVLVLNVMAAPCRAIAPVVVAAPRLTVMPLPVICPDAPLALRPVAPAGVTVMVLPGGTVQLVFVATAGKGQSTAQAGETIPPNSAIATANGKCVCRRIGASVAAPVVNRPEMVLTRSVGACGGKKMDVSGEIKC